MSIFQNALNFLTGKKQELDQEEVKLQVENKILKELFITQEEVREEKPCENKIIYNTNNQSLQVIFCEGDVIQGFGISWEIAQKCKTATIQEVIKLLSPIPESVNEVETNHNDVEKELVSNFLDMFDSVDDFEVIENSVYFSGVKSVEIPSLIVARFVELISEMEVKRQDNYYEFTKLEQEYQSLKAFTLKLLLNPIKESREHCLEFVRNFDIKLTNTGNMVMFRRIVSVEDSNKDLIEFVSKQYLKVKSWKKSPKNYYVLFNEEGAIYNISLTESSKPWTTVGNLDELYNNLTELTENRYTDNHTKSYDIRIGATYKINDEDIDLNKNGSCGGSLHLADGKKFSYSSFGDTPVVCLVSPQHIYKMDSGYSGKIGVKQMFVAAITTQDEEGNYEDIDSQDLVNFDELYHNESIEELTQALQTKSLEATSVSTAVSEVSLKDVQNIKDLLSKRVVNI